MDPQLLGLSFSLDQELDPTGQPDLCTPPTTHASASGHGLPQPTHFAASGRDGDALAGADGSAGPPWQYRAAGPDGAGAAMHADPCMASGLSPPLRADTSSAAADHQPTGMQASASAHAAGRPPPPRADHAHVLTADGGYAAHAGPRKPQHAAEAAAGPAGRAPRRRSAETQRAGRGTVSLRRPRPC